MSANKDIHPRNIYKKHPDFTELSSKYPEFNEICTLDTNGKPTVDFQDEKTLAVLTKCLLDKDFGLSVTLPADRLIPTLPLRLNYILWIEDIMQAFGIKDPAGVDIGCGASCIYPLLAAKKNDWTVTGLEVDKDSYQNAQLNVTNNRLQDKISLLLLHNPENGIFEQLLAGNSSTFDFCLCNPPFYDHATEPQNRTGTRPGPRNAKTGSEIELSCRGGEVSFIKRIFEGSFRFKSRIRVFTTMIGIKNDLFVLVKELRRLGVTNYTETEFCQGRTTRWGLAWTFDEENYLRTVPCINSIFLKDPAIFFIPESDFQQLQKKCLMIEDHLMKLLEEIEIEPVPLPRVREDEKRWRLKAYKVSWTNARGRRRRKERQGTVQSKEAAATPPTKKPRLENIKPILVGDIYLNTVNNGQTLQIFYLDGVQGRDACQQILQFIINRFNKIF